MRLINGLPLLMMGVALVLGACSKQGDEPKVEPVASKAAAMPDTGGVEHVKVTTIGTGETLFVAIDAALKLAIEQTNGKSIESEAINFKSGFDASKKYHGKADVSIDNDSAQLTVDTDESVSVRSSGFADYIKTQSKGVVSDFRLVSQEKSLFNKTYTVTVESNIAKYKRPESANRMRIVVAPLRYGNTHFIVDAHEYNGDEIGHKIQQTISDALTNTQRVTVLDRDANEAADAEMDLIANGKASSEDLDRLGQQLPADFLWVATIEAFEYRRHERQLRTSNRTLVSYSGIARLSHRLINVTTRQVLLSDSIQMDLPETEPTTMGVNINVEQVMADMNKYLGDGALRQIMDRLFPITVLSRSGSDVVLSQGQASLKKGERYRVVRLGDELTDPQTGQKLGRIEKDCCEVIIDRAEDKLSYGSLTKISIQLPETLAAGELIVRDNLGKVNAPEENIDIPSKSEINSVKASSENSAKNKKTESNAPSALPKEDKNW